MKHAKIILAALMILLALPAGAQVHKSKSFVKKTQVKEEIIWPKWVWYVRAGIALPTWFDVSADDISTPPGFDLDFGFQRAMGKKGWYWGLDAAFITQSLTVDQIKLSGVTYKGQSFTGVGGRIGANVGWRLRASDIFWMDFHTGFAVEAHQGVHMTDGEYHRDLNMYSYVELSDINAYIPIGIGFKVKMFTFDIQFRPNLVNTLTYKERSKNAVEHTDAIPNFLISAGVAF